MFGAFQTFGKLGAIGKAISAAWSPLSLWPTGTEPGMWIDPSNLTSQWQDSTGTTPVATPGTVADSSNPVGLALDLRLGATALTDPGNHLLQATSTARPLESARVNLLTDSGGTWPGVWGAATITSGANDPDGGATAFQIDMPAANTGRNKLISESLTGKPLLASLYIKADVAGTVRFFDGTGGSFDTTLNVTTQWQRLAANSAIRVGTGHIEFGIYRNDAGQLSKVYVWHPQLEVNTTTTPYQRVTTASDYDATGITPFQIYDGTDDGMATASFAAGTLTSDMDCLIAVRRDSAANAVCGLYESVAEANKVFGIAESGSSSGCVGSGAGTPTVWVDGVQLTGGTAVTRATLHTALSAGDIHILEFRGLDLSTWTASGFGLYTSYKLLGARGDIMLFPSPADATERDKARQYLADKYGVTLA